MDFRIDPDFVSNKALYCLFYAAFSCMVLYLPIYFVDLGLEVWQIGIMLGIEPAIVFLLSPIWGAAADRFSKHKLALVLALIGSGLFYISIVFIPLISSQFTETSLNIVVEFSLDSSLNTDHCSLGETLVFQSSESEGNSTCYELCESVSESSSIHSKDNGSEYLCNMINESYECSACLSEDNVGVVVNRGLSALSSPTNLTVLMLLCDPGHLREVTSSPISDEDSSKVHGGQNHCEVMTSCSCDVTYGIRTPTSQRVNFWLCFLLVALGISFRCNIPTFMDALVIQKLGPGKGKNFGKHRLWGAVGWGIIAFFSGYANDLFTRLTNSANTRYEPVFLILLICMSVSVVMSALMEYPEHEQPKKMHQDLFLLFKQPALILFLFVLVIQGISFGQCFSLLFIYLASELEASHTLIGLSVFVSTMTEMPALFVAGKVIKTIGYDGVVYVTMAAYIVRYIGYASIQNPWWVLLFQALHGITFGLGWTAFTNYANTNAPKGMAATLMAITAGMFYGVGVGFGNFFGGFIVEAVGFRKLFLVNVSLQIFTLILFFVVNQCFIKRLSSAKEDDLSPGISSRDVGGGQDDVKTNWNGHPRENEKVGNPEEEIIMDEEESSKV